MKFTIKKSFLKFLLLSLLIVLSNTLQSQKFHSSYSNNLESDTSSQTVFAFLNNLNRRNSNNKINSYRFRQGGNSTNSTPTTSKNSTSPKLNSNKNSTNPNSNSNSTDPDYSPYIQDLSSPSTQLQDWLSISSHAFKNPRKYPNINLPDGTTAKLKFGTEQERLNEQYLKSRAEGSDNESAFWFKIRGGYLYYFATKQDINILGSILVNKIENSDQPNKHSNGTDTCFSVYDNSNDKYTICASTNEIKLKWFCSIQSFLEKDKDELSSLCYPNQSLKATVVLDNQIVEIKNITQPLIIIPTASRKCNQNWNYANKGADWECQCSEGREQSPIDLPSKNDAILSSLRPIFQYDTVRAMAVESTLDGTLIAGEYVKIRYENNAIRIKHPNMGKIVAIDGGVFQAEEIVFHTPSEHKINGQAFDMEMQIIHYGKSRGDIAKQIILSFLFKAKPGVYNKFIDKLDFFNLPNPLDTYRDITNDFYIPSIFYTTDDDDIPTMKPFSFYTYSGSITAPPCTERTTHYVTADPIDISNTVIQLFREALKMPDVMSEKGEMQLGNDEIVENTRKLQEKNGRTVVIYDHKKFNCPEFQRKKRPMKPSGHYEKREKIVNEYLFVNGNEPSGLPDSYVVSESEARGVDDPVAGLVIEEEKEQGNKKNRDD
jgi:carbonic anhydrase